MTQNTGASAGWGGITIPLCEEMRLYNELPSSVRKVIANSAINTSSLPPAQVLWRGQMTPEEVCENMTRGDERNKGLMRQELHDILSDQPFWERFRANLIGSVRRMAR